MGAFGVTDDEFTAWLGRDGVRVVLAEAVAYSGAATETRYLASFPFCTRPIDTPANQIYTDLILEIPAFEAKLTEAFSGRSLPSFGDLVIYNPNGILDDWLADGWDGRALALKIGSPRWHIPDFRPLLTGVVADIDAPSRDTIALKLRDKGHLFDIPVQTNLIGGTTANADQPVPLCFGECFNVEAVLTDAATHTYQVHDGAINAISEVRDNGVSVAFTANLAAGTFTLSSAPAGRITADVQGAAPSGRYLTQCHEIVEWLALNKAGLASSELDPVSFPALNIDLTRATTPTEMAALLTAAGATFTRADSTTCATWEDADGVLQTVAANLPRPRYVSGVHRGLWVEESRINLVSWSSYNAATWTLYFPTYGTVTTGIDDIFGGTGAVRLVTNGLGTVVFRVAIPAFTPNGTDQYSISFFCRKNSGSGSVLCDLQDLNQFDYSADLVTGSWVRVTRTFTPSATSKTFIDLWSNNSAAYSLDFDGVQLEKGGAASSLIVAVGAVPTRAADVPVMTGSNFSRWYGGGAGTVLCAYTQTPNTSDTNALWTISGASAALPVIASRIGYNSFRRVRSYARDIGVVFQYAIEGFISSATSGSVAVAFSATNDMAQSENGGAVVADTSGTIVPSSGVELQIGKNSGTYLNGGVSRIIYWSARLPNTDLPTLSAGYRWAPATPLGLYIKERRNLIDVIDDLVTSIGAFWTFTRAGLLRLGRLEAPAGTADLTLIADDIEAESIGLAGRDLPAASVRLGYAKNWTPQDPDGLAGAVSEADRTLYAAPHSVAKATNSVSTQHLLAPNPDVVETLIVTAADALTEAERRAALRSVVRTTVRLTTFAQAHEINLGDVADLTHPRFGFSAGELAVVTALRERALDGRVELELWK